MIELYHSQHNMVVPAMQWKKNTSRSIRTVTLFIDAGGQNCWSGAQNLVDHTCFHNNQRSWLNLYDMDCCWGCTADGDMTSVWLSLRSFDSDTVWSYFRRDQCYVSISKGALKWLYDHNIMTWGNVGSKYRYLFDLKSSHVLCRRGRGVQSIPNEILHRLTSRQRRQTVQTLTRGMHWSLPSYQPTILTRFVRNIHPPRSTTRVIVESIFDENESYVKVSIQALWNRKQSTHSFKRGVVPRQCVPDEFSINVRHQN